MSEGNPRPSSVARPNHDQTSRRVNPFRAACLVPGVVPYLPPAGVALDALLNRFAEQQFRGQIVGPHGTGKSTLLHEIVQHATSTGQAVTLVTYRAGAGISTNEVFQASHAALLAIDGFEQLPWHARWRLMARRRNTGLLITTHERQFGLPVLLRTAATLEALRHAATFLWKHQMHAGTPLPEALADDAFLNRLLADHGDIREALFALYDWYAQTDDGRWK